jgi:hypothetical protein
MLEEEFPTLIGLECQAHGLAMLLKDLGGFTKKTPKSSWLSKLYSTAKMLSNAVNDSEKIRQLLQC